MDRAYRYTLWRSWQFDPMLSAHWEGITNEDKYLMVIGLNPSTADEEKNDPTIRRCINFAKSWGFGGLAMTNLFGFRATDPRDMKLARDPIGSENDHWLETVAKDPYCGMVLAAWGVHGSHGGRNISVETLITAHKPLYALKLNDDGSPGHPLYVAATTKPRIYKSNL